MKIITFLLSFCFCITVFAQNYNFGKVSKEELEEKYNPLDSSANATYLYKFRKTFFEYQQEKGFELITEIHERIKIYNQEGFDYATQVVGHSKSGSDREEMNSLKAYTYNLENGKIEETKLDKDGVFENEENDYYEETKFTMPNIKAGSVVEYKYRVKSPFFWSVDDFEFQFDVPIKKLEATFESPEYFNFKVNTKGFLLVSPQTETRRDKITFTSKTRTGGNGMYDAPARTTFESNDIEFTKSTSKYDLDNVPALKEEPFVNSINNYRSAIQYELSYTKFPQSPMKYFSTTWEDVVKTIYESPNFGSELDKTGYFENDIDALIGSVSNPIQRAALIFNFVKSKVKWNGYYGKYTQHGVKKAYKDQVGNVAEINLMLTAMMRYAGLMAYPVLVSTRQNGIPLFPTRDGYNYIVSCVKLADGDMLLDATNKYAVPNVLPFRALNWQGRIISENGGSELIDLYPNQKSEDKTSVMLNLDNQGNVEGSFRSLKTNHTALLYRENYNDKDKDNFLEKLENKYNGMEISDFEVKNDTDLSKPILESYKFVKENQADIIGDKFYFSPLLFLKTTESPFKLEKREYPVDFGYPSSSTYMVVINLPKGYKIESLPKPEAFMMPDALGVFKYNITGNDTSIQLVVTTEINQSIITPVYYDALKGYFKQLVEKEAEQVVLTKI